MPLEIVTFGCRLNAFESEAIRRHAAAAGLDDAVIVNTCAVTAEAERQARQAIRRARREHPGARLIVTGCAAQIDPARFAAMPEVDPCSAMTRSCAPRATAIRRARRRRRHHGACARPRRISVDGFDGRARAFVAGAAGLRPSLHLLHHPLWPRRRAARCRSARSCAQARARWSSAAIASWC